MFRILAVTSVALALAACAPPAPPPAPKVEAPTITPAPTELAASFTDCTWGEVSGGGVTVNAFTCPTSKLQGDEALPGIVQVITMADGKTITSPVFQVFPKAADAPIESVLAAVRAASPGAATCALTEAKPGATPETRKVYELTPTGKDKAKYEAFLAGKNDDFTMPCGPLGPSETGQRTFEVSAQAPSKVVLIFWPSDIPSWDKASLKIAP